jgi:hypothetical protein
MRDPWRGNGTLTMTDASEPGSPGVTGEDPTRQERTDDVGALDESPEGHTPGEPTESGEDSLPPGA